MLFKKSSEQRFAGLERDEVKQVYTILMFLVLITGDAYAHRVYIFADIEGDTVYTESRFSAGKPVKNGNISAYDVKKNLLIEGETDKAGKFSFKMPDSPVSKIVLDDGMGHQAEWVFDSEDMHLNVWEKDNREEAFDPATDRSEIHTDCEETVRAILAKEIKPLKERIRKLEADAEGEPSLRDILGGIGYIIGLVGIAAYFNFRRKTKD